MRTPSSINEKEALLVADREGIVRLDAIATAITTDRPARPTRCMAVASLAEIRIALQDEVTWLKTYRFDGTDQSRRCKVVA